MFRKLLVVLFLCLQEFHSISNYDEFEIANRIIAGYRCSIEDHPYMIGLMPVTGYTILCGGSLLAPFWVLSARHCVNSYPTPEHCMVVAGTVMSNRKQWGEDVQTSIVKAWYEHDVADFVLLHLKTAIVESRSVAYVKLATYLNVIDRTLQDICFNSTVMGWGQQIPETLGSKPGGGGVRDHHLQCLQIPVIAKKTCNDMLNKKISDSDFCAYKLNADSCVGDSGSPLMCNGIQYGIVSSGIGCAVENYPGFYVDIHLFDTYIHNIITGACDLVPVCFPRGDGQNKVLLST